jgi:chromosome partitioning protein
MSHAATSGGRCPIVSLASTKGGVGKTTLAYVLATELARRLEARASRPFAPADAGWRGRITCIDTDPNGTLSQVLRLTDAPMITGVESDSERLLADLRAGQARSDLVLIDLEGTANQAMLYAAGKSDLVLVPAQPSRFDVVEAVKTIGVVRKAADLVDREIAHRVVLSRTPVLRQREAEHSRAQFVRAALPLLAIELVQRAAFQSMTYSGRPPYQQDGGEAAAENVTRLTDAVLAIIGLDLPAADHAAAAADTGETYDPAFLREIGARGIQPDEATATTWYRKAAALGDPAARERARRMEEQHPR